MFAAAFVGMSFGMPWASKGFSVAAVNSTPAKPDAPAPQVQPHAIVEAPAERAAQRPTSGTRSRSLLRRPHLLLRQFTPMPAIASPRPRCRPRKAYARAPCDRVAKTMFIVAASTYLRAQDATTQAPKDARVHDAIKTAFQTGHVSADEFPPDLMISGRFAPAPPSRASCVNSAGLRP